MTKSMVLIGMPQSGKSSVGQKVADRIGYTFKDIDRLIEEAYFQKHSHLLSCQDIYKKEGADYFRALEEAVFGEALREEQVVIATGGGTPIHTSGFNQLTENTQVIFLYCTFEILWQRISALKVTPPLISVGNPFMTFQELYKSRLVQYLAYSHHKIDTSHKDLDEIVETIITTVNPRLSF